MLTAVIRIYPLALIPGSTRHVYSLCFITGIFAAITTVLGAGIDQLCIRARYTFYPDFEQSANKLMLQQVWASIYALAPSVILVKGRGLP